MCFVTICSTSAYVNIFSRATEGRAMPLTLPTSLEHVPCKAPTWPTWEPRLRSSKTVPVSLLIFLLTETSSGCSQEPHSPVEIHLWWTKDNLLENKSHLLLYRNKISMETGLKYQRKTLMCGSPNLPRWGDLICSIALETSYEVEYCS